jgi:predicted phosphodiesterase
MIPRKNRRACFSRRRSVITNARIEAEKARTTIGRRLRILLFVIVLSSPLAAETVRFAVIADTHIGAGTAAADLQSIVGRINALPGLDFAVLVGDIAEKGRDAEFAEAKRLLGGLKIPWHVVPGNHDSHWIGQGLIGFREASASDRFFFEKSGQTFIGLNSWDFGHLAPEDIKWLAMSAEAASRAGAVFVFVHNPPAYVDNWFKAQAVLRARKSVVLSGHVHNTRILDSSGLPVVTVRRAMAAAAIPPGFVLIESAADGISVFEMNGSDDPKLIGIIAPDKLGLASDIPPPVRTRDEVEIIGRADLGTRVSLAPVLAGDLIVVANNSGKISAFDESGSPRWSHDPEALCAARPWADENFVYAATAKGRILKLDAVSGRVLKRGDVGERVTSQLTTFVSEKGERRLLAGTLSGRMICLDAATLETVWASEESKDMIQSRPLIVGGRVIFGSWDARVHALDVETGRFLWRWSENYNFYFAPAGCVSASDGKSIFICCPDGFVSAIDLETGKTLWREKYSAWESLSLSRDRARLFVKNRTDEFNILAAATGHRLVQSSPAHGNGDIMPIEPVEWEGHVYYGGLNGRVYDVDKAGRIKAILDLGPAGIHTLLPLGEGRFAALNLDGTLVVFSVGKNIIGEKSPLAPLYKRGTGRGDDTVSFSPSSPPFLKGGDGGDFLGQRGRH